MDSLFYYKKLKSALGENNDSKIEMLARTTRNDIINSDDKKSLFLVPFFDFLCEFMLPFIRFMHVVCERLNEEEIPNTDWHSLESKYELLTISQLYDYMTNEVSPYIVQQIVNQLECSVVAKSDIMDSINKRDFDLFNNTIHEKDIDYTVASNICSHVVFFTKTTRNYWNKICELFEVDSTDEYLDLDELNQQVSLTKNLAYESMHDVATKIDGTKEYLENFSKELRESPDTFNAKFKMFAGHIMEFQNATLEDLLLPMEQQILSDFVARKSETVPVVKGFFELYTKGQYLHPDFEFIPDGVEDEDVTKMLESCISQPCYEEITSDCNEDGDNQLDDIDSTKDVDTPPQVSSETIELYPKDEIGKCLDAVFKKYPLLSTERARKYLRIALEREYIVPVSDVKWKWNGRSKIKKCNLAYFLSRIYFYEEVKVKTKDKHKDEEWTQTTNDKLYERGMQYSIKDIRTQIKLLFDGDDILQERSKRNNGKLPDHRDIDHLVPLDEKHV